VSDFPGVSLDNRLVFFKISELLLRAEKNITAESPYFVLRDGGFDLLRKIKNKGVSLRVLTNGLSSTDAFYTVSPMIFAFTRLRQSDLKLYLYNGDILPGTLSVDRKVSKRWGIHSKRAVIDDKHLIIGTYNVDPRSANLNSEIIVICEDAPELALMVKSEIEKRIEYSRELFGENKNPLDVLIQGASFKDKILFYLSIPLAKLFDFLL
jgi:putative cardiolipin synthase